MKLAKNMLLGAAATLVSVGAANAADLPSRTKGPAAEYVKICDWIAAEGFYVIPGTDTCIKVGGYVRAQYQIQTTRNTFSAGGFGVANTANGQPGVAVVVGPTLLPTLGGVANNGSNVLIAGQAAGIGNAANWARNQENQGASARGTAVLDARTRTAYGTLRAVMALEANSSWGRFGNTGGTFNVDKAFIQWAGLTAGRAESFFEFFDNVADNTFIGIRGSANSSELFAYTATFGGGFQATVSVENPVTRRTSTQLVGFNGAAPGFGANPGIAGTVTQFGSFLGAGNILPSRAPDVVAALYVEQSWGSAQLSGVAHQTTAGATVANGFAGGQQISKSVTGYAVLAGVKINLPMLAAGDFLLLQGVYADGATSYLGYGATANNIGTSFLRPNADFTWNTVTGQTQKEKGYNLIVEARHYWTPTVYQEVFGSYTQITPGSTSKTIDWTLGGIGRQREYVVGSQLVWTPVKGFYLGIEGMYFNTSNRLAGPVTTWAPPAGYKASNDGFAGRVRINRAF